MEMAADLISEFKQLQPKYSHVHICEKTAENISVADMMFVKHFTRPEQCPWDRPTQISFLL
uniref:Uncharacterized protein n=1 Tax=Arion vulgaris TaxID=1028688 RepID=A0A0B6Y1C3_9EUPU